MRASYLTSLAIGLSICLSHWPARSTGTEIPCPAREHAIEVASNDIFSVKRSADDEAYLYIFTIDLNYEDLTLMDVQVLYVTGDKLMLSAKVETSPIAESQVRALVFVDRAISTDVRLVWSYFRSGALCPEIRHFRYDLTEK